MASLREIFLRKDIINKFILCLIFFLISSFNLQAQNKYFWKLSCAEKVWVITHCFVAKKAWGITQEVKKISALVKNDRLFDGDENGGQIDAFRHAFWMASLTQQICWRKAKKLGKAHEKGNKRDFKKHRLEQGTLPDAISCEMDLKNNNVGLTIGKENKEASQEKLVNTIKQAILQGELWKIKKDENGNYLDCNGNILKKEDYQGTWYNNKCLIRSDY